MSARRNPLEVLLRLRGIREAGARRLLGRATVQMREAERERDERERDYRFRPLPPSTVSPVELRALQLQGIGDAELVEQATEALMDAQAQRERARLEWMSSLRDVRSAERLHEKRQEEAARLAQRAAERALDEIVVTRRHVREKP